MLKGKRVYLFAFFLTLLTFFIQGTVLYLKYYFTPYSNIDAGTLLIPFIISYEYNSCLFKGGKPNFGEKTDCVFSYRDSGKVCSVNKDCLSGKCLLDKNTYEMEKSKQDKKNNETELFDEKGQIIIKPYFGEIELPNNIKGNCAPNNERQCMNEIVIGLIKGKRSAYLEGCFD